MSYFSFKKTEIFQLLNHRPVSAVEIQLLIDNSEERLSEDQVRKVQNQVLQFTNQYSCRWSCCCSWCRRPSPPT